MEAIHLRGDVISERRQFVQIDEATRNKLRNLAPVLEKGIDQALEGLYTSIRARPDRQRLFRDEQHMARARAAQKAHRAQIAQGNFGPKYVESTRTMSELVERFAIESRPS